MGKRTDSLITGSIMMFKKARNGSFKTRYNHIQETKYYRIIRAFGISKEITGASGHGLRHAYAQSRYEQITGFKPPCKFDSKEGFRKNALRIAGNDWEKLNQDARQIIKGEMGHGPDRDDIVSQYLGSV